MAEPRSERTPEPWSGRTPERPGGAETRWRRRPAVARTLRLLVLLGPVAASFGAAMLVRHWLPHPAGLVGRAGVLVVLVLVSTLALVVVDQTGRRLLPLVTLLDLSMLFPDRAPSRVRMAREAIRRRPIEEQLRRVREAGADPGTAAREILGLVAALSVHDKPTRGHAERVRMFTDLLAESLKVPKRDRDLLRWAAILHDIGKLRVPASLLNKPGKPTADEWTVLKAHPAHGAELAAALLPWLGEWGTVIVEHHERYDGTGYPHGIAGRSISLGARIVSVADAYDVMTAARAYKRPVSRAAALRELVRFSGTQFDPVVVRAMVSVGAPGLRRSQGVLAWLSDVPLVATGTVPAATVARVVGAGALASGAVAGALGVTVPFDIAPPRAGTSVAAPQGDAPQNRSDRPEEGTVRSDRTRTTRAVQLVTASDQMPAADEPAVERGAADQVDPEPSGGHPSAVDPARSPAATSTSTKPQPAPAPGGDRSPAPAPKPAPVGAVVGTVTDTVDRTVKNPDGTVAGTVDGTVSTVTTTVNDVVTDPVGTVTGTVEDVATAPVGTVTGALGSLTGAPKPASSPSSSPTPSRSGILGGLLGK